MWRDEYNKANFGLNYDRPRDFLLCYWQKTEDIKMIWIVYRCLLVLYFALAGLVIVILRDLEDSPWYKNPIFYYYWVYFVELTAFCLALVSTVIRYQQEKKNPELPPLEKMPWYLKIMWLCYSIAGPCATVITFVFIIFVYSKDSYKYLTYAIITHICNSVTIIIDFLLGGVPFRLLHFYIPLVFSISYGLFTYIYQMSGGTGNQGKIPIYSVLDWRNVGLSAKTCGVHLTCIALMHCGFWMLHIGKRWLRYRREEEV